MAVRAKFRCNSIKLMQSSGLKSGYKYDAQSKTNYRDPEGNEVHWQDAHRNFDQPTVELTAVTGGSEENQAFFSATPVATINLTISNPDAAETFELGKEYYVDFSPAS